MIISIDYYLHVYSVIPNLIYSMFIYRFLYNGDQRIWKTNLISIGDIVVNNMFDKFLLWYLCFALKLLSTIRLDWCVDHNNAKIDV